MKTYTGIYKYYTNQTISPGKVITTKSYSQVWPLSRCESKVLPQINHLTSWRLREHVSVPIFSSVSWWNYKYHNDSRFSDRQMLANTVDPNQTGPECVHCLPFCLHLLNSFLFVYTTPFKFWDNNSNVYGCDVSEFLGYVPDLYSISLWNY